MHRQTQTTCKTSHICNVDSSERSCMAGSVGADGQAQNYL